MKTQFITDNKGHKIAVVLSVREYQKMLADVEELEDILLYDDAKSSKEISIPINDAFKIIEAKRKKKSWVTK